MTRLRLGSRGRWRNRYRFKNPQRMGHFKNRYRSMARLRLVSRSRLRNRYRFMTRLRLGSRGRLHNRYRFKNPQRMGHFENRYCFMTGLRLGSRTRRRNTSQIDIVLKIHKGWVILRIDIVLWLVYD